MAHKRYQKTQALTIAVQKFRIRQLYGNIIEELKEVNSELICVINLQPSEHSDIYKIKITYKISDACPKAWLLSPTLRTYDGKKPHHVYEKDKYGHYRLCVYYPKDKNWNQQMLIAESFIPWICTWLSTYEYWLITGEWHYDEVITKKSKLI